MATKKVIEVEVKTGAAQKNVEDLNEGLQETASSAKNVGKEASASSELAGQAAGGLGARFNALKGVLGLVTNSFKTLRGAIIASGIGALALAVIAIGQAFTRTEEGQNKFAKIMAVIGVVTDKFLDILADLGDTIISVFTKPIETIKKLGDSIVSFFKNPLDTIRNMVSETKEFIKETEKAAQAAARIADQRAKADKIERGLIVSRAEADRDRADLLEKAQQRDKFSQEERIGFLREASAIEEKITNQEIRLAQIRRDAIIESNSLAKSGKKDLEEEEEAKAAVIRLETARLTKQKEVTSQVQGLIEQEKAARNAAYQERRRQIEAEKEAKIKAAEEEAKRVAQIEHERLQNLKNIENDFRAQLEAAENEYFDSLLTNQEREEIAIQDKYFNLIEQAKQFNIDTTTLETAQQEELKKIQDKYRDEKKELDDKAAEDDIKRAKALEDAKAQAQAQGFQTIQSITSLFANANEKTAKKAFAISKAASIAQTLIDTYKGAQAIFASAAANPATILFPAQPFIAAGAAIASGLANVAAIKNQQFGSTGGGGVNPTVPSFGGGGGSGGGISAASQAPNFNIVGNAGINPLQGLSEPIKAFVVSSDITTAQGLERSKIETATL